ncbi:MAG: hypothetical protein V2A62_03505 [Candidatus Woesearchaeota archaeon]
MAEPADALGEVKMKIFDYLSKPKVISAILGVGLFAALTVPVFMGRNNSIQTEEAANPSISAKVDEVYTFYENYRTVQGGSLLVVPEEEAEYARLKDSDRLPSGPFFQVEVAASDNSYYTKPGQGIAPTEPHPNYAFRLIHNSKSGNFSVVDRFGDGINEFEFDPSMRGIPSEDLPAINKEYEAHLDRLIQVLSGRYGKDYSTPTRTFPREYWNAGEVR